MTTTHPDPVDATPDTRTQILDAFAGQLTNAGYLGASLIEVGRTVGIRRPSIYHHFPDGKEEVFIAVAERFIDGAGDRITRAISTPGTLRDKLTALVAAVAASGANTSSLEQRIYEALDHVTDATRTSVSDRYVAGLLTPVSELFASAVAAGDVTGDPEFLMNAFLHLARATDLLERPEDATRIVDLFLDGARPA
ncbi:TetR/AcrR family transcriptional regulator [Gordonia terrae]